MDVYKFAIDNTKAFIRSEENQLQATTTGTQLTAFNAARVLAIAFMKDTSTVLADLIK